MGNTYPGSIGTLTYGYDSAGRLQTITDWASRISTFAYDDAGRIASLARPGGLLTELGYDDADRPTSAVTTRNGNPVLSLAYGYDAAGNLTSFTDDTGTSAFGYDELDRLISAAYPGGQSYAYAYDPVGNITSLTTPAGTQAFSYDPADRLTTVGYSYDDNGALTADPTRTYTYDALGRLTQVGVGGATTAYTLDGDGNRWAETTGGLTTSFDLDLRGYPTILADGTRTYLPGAPAAGYEQAGTWYSGLTDLHGSLLGTVSQSGSVSAFTRYDP